MSKEVYVILTDEPLDRRSLMIVDNEEKAKLITKDDDYMSYQSVRLLSDNDIKDIICDERLRNIDNGSEFVDIHCMNCETKYYEDCPYML